MVQQQINIDDIILKIKNKSNKILVFTPDSKDVPLGSIIYNYDLVNTLNTLGYNAFVLTEQESEIPHWLDLNKYENTPKLSFKTEGLTLEPSDFLLIGELYINLIAELKKNKIPCEIIILCQAYEYIFEYLPVGHHWKFEKINSVIYTGEKVAKHVSDIMYGMKNEYILPPQISNLYSKHEKPQKPIISIVTRNPKDSDQIFKIFYQKYPQYRWVTFQFLAKLDQSLFADNLKQSCLSVWVDPVSSFGTFPLESMKCGVPVLGVIPNLIPEWMEEENEGVKSLRNNGIWVTSKLSIPDYIGNFLDNWLTDSISNNLYIEMESTVSKYNDKNFEVETAQIFDKIFNNRVEHFNILKNKINE